MGSFLVAQQVKDPSVATIAAWVRFPGPGNSTCHWCGQKKFYFLKKERIKNSNSYTGQAGDINEGSGLFETKDQ